MDSIWEYDRVVIDFKATVEIKPELNVLGAQGWEIIYYDETSPKKFGDKGRCVVLIKRMKSCMKEKQL